MKTLVLYLTNLRVAIRYCIVLIVVVLALLALVIASLPRDLFNSKQIPQVSVAVVNGSDERLSQDLQTYTQGIEALSSLVLCGSSEAEALLNAGEVDAVISMPDNTFDALVNGKHATITVKATDPLLGAVIYSVVQQAAQSLDDIQSQMLVYRSAAEKKYGYSSEQYNQAVRGFASDLLGDVLARNSYVEIPQQPTPYYIQLLTILLFMIVSTAGFFVAIALSRQYASGSLKRLYVRGVRFGHVLAANLLLSCSISLILVLLPGLVLQSLDPGFSLALWLLSAVALSVILTPLYLIFSGLGTRDKTPNNAGAVGKVAATRTMLGCLALLFCLLFVGGGFYPTFLMQSSLRLFNPTWAANLLSSWVLGANLDGALLLLFAVPVVVGCALSYWEWRRQLW